MARHNMALVYGYVNRDVMLTYNESGGIVKASFSLIILRGLKARDHDMQKEVEYTSVLTLTRDPEKAQEMQKIRKNDLVLVKGTVSTANVIKIKECPECHNKNKLVGMVTYVEPLQINVIGHEDDETEKFRHLKKFAETSNEVTLIGTLCRDPICYHTNDNIAISEYQIGVNRKKYIASDGQDKKTDFPWIKTYGEKAAKADGERLHKGSYVFIDAHFHSRTFQRTIKCQNCNASFLSPETQLDIVTYAREYLRNCYTEEDIVHKNEEQAQKVMADLGLNPVIHTNPKDENSIEHPVEIPEYQDQENTPEYKKQNEEE